MITLTNASFLISLMLKILCNHAPIIANRICQVLWEKNPNYPVYGLQNHWKTLTWILISFLISAQPSSYFYDNKIYKYIVLKQYVEANNLLCRYIFILLRLVFAFKDHRCLALLFFTDWIPQHRLGKFQYVFVHECPNSPKSRINVQTANFPR